jgi:hypothetical protein
MPTKSRQSPATPHGLRALLNEVITEMNDSVPSARELRRMLRSNVRTHKAWARKMAKAESSEQQSLLNAMLADSANDKGHWSNYFASLRFEYYRMMSTLAGEGRLPKADLEELADTINGADGTGMTFKCRVVDNASLIMEPEVKHLRELRWAYAVFKLAEAGPVNFEVRICKKQDCDNLILLDKGKGVGRRREYCSPAHTNAANQADFKRRKALAAAKHK